MSGSYSEHTRNLAACIRATASNLEEHLQAGDDTEVDRHVLIIVAHVATLVGALPQRFGAVGAKYALDKATKALEGATGLSL